MHIIHSTHGKLYIFGKVRPSSFQKYIVFHGYYEDIYLAVIKVSPIFPVRFTLFPNTESFVVVQKVSHCLHWYCTHKICDIVPITVAAFAIQRW